MYLLYIQKSIPQASLFFSLKSITNLPEFSLNPFKASSFSKNLLYLQKMPKATSNFMILGMVLLDMELRAIYEHAYNLPYIRLRRGNVIPVRLQCVSSIFLGMSSYSLLVKALREEMAALHSTCPTFPIGSPLKANFSHVPLARGNVQLLFLYECKNLSPINQAGHSITFLSTLHRPGEQLRLALLINAQCQTQSLDKQFLSQEVQGELRKSLYFVAFYFPRLISFQSCLLDEEQLEEKWC